VDNVYLILMPSKKKTKHNRARNKSTRRTRKLKPMKCAPAVIGKSSKRDSCLTDSVLVQLKNAYNNNHPDTRILSTKPTKIWSDLQKRLPFCKKEDCWLEQIHDKNVRDEIDRRIFAPDKPEKWKLNPSTWLTNVDIVRVLKQYEEHYPSFKCIGPSPIDFDTRPIERNNECVSKELCDFDLNALINAGKRQFGIVFNLDKHDQSGSHWVSLFIDMNDRFLFFLDSNGDPIPNEIDVLAKRIIQQAADLPESIELLFHENHPMEHQKENNECGMYSLFFIITMLTNKTSHRTFTNANDKISFFKQKRIPDKFVFKLRNLYFNTP